MTRLRAALAAALVLTTAACASTTSGSGSVSAASRSSAAHPTDFPSQSAGPTDSAPATTSAPPSAPASTTPVAAPAPPECAAGTDCKLVKSWDVGGGRVVGVFSAPSASGGVGASVLLLGRDEVPVFWHAFDSETPGELLCKVAGALANCVLVDYVGAHAATAYPLVVDGDSLRIGSSVGSDTPGLHAVDFDHDLLVDAVGLQNDYEPDYASGHVQWQTWRRSSDGLTLQSTGCGPLAVSAPTQPVAFQTGRCRPS